jgi:hypothetical protein
LHLNRKKFGLALALCALAIPVAALPAMASAKSPGSERKQSKRITKVNKNLLQLAGSVGSLRTGTDKLISELGSASADVATLKALSSALPPILSALRDGLTAVGNGLKAMVPFTKQTYVATQLYAGTPSAANTIQGCFMTSPQLPITGNSVNYSMRCLAIPGSSYPAGQVGFPVNAQATCRSSKTNVDGTSTHPCAQAGILTLTVATVGGATYTQGFLTSKAQTSGPLAGAPVYDINKRTGLFDNINKAFPFSFTANDEAGNQLNLTDTSGTGNATLSGAGATNLPGAPAYIDVSMRALDRDPDLSASSPAL